MGGVKVNLQRNALEMRSNGYAFTDSQLANGVHQHALHRDGVVCATVDVPSHGTAVVVDALEPNVSKAEITALLQAAEPTIQEKLERRLHQVVALTGLAHDTNVDVLDSTLPTRKATPHDQ